MGLYSQYILPKVVDWACNQSPNRKQREKVVPLASGNILEIGVGSGLNLPFYNKDQVNHLIGIDPSQEMWQKKTVDLKSLEFEVEFIEGYAEKLPLENNCMDSIVLTYTLCTISDTEKALSEVKRVLKSNGKLIFCEHGKAPDKGVERWQNIINPIWKKLGGGCNLNRNIPEILKKNGLKINTIEAMYIPGWKPASYNFWGIAKNH